jgi:DNA repair exonuclease SbcCD ATPase subunit
LQAAIPLLREKEVEVRNAGEQATSKAAALQEQQQKSQTSQQQRNVLLAGRSADEVERELIQAEKATRENLERANRELETANSASIAASKSVEHWNDELDKRKAAQDSAYHQLNCLLTEQGLELATLRRRLQRDTAWLEAERAVLDKLKTDDERTQERLKERRDNREQQTTNPPEHSLEEAQVHLARAQAEGTAAHNAWVEISAQLRQDENRRTQAVQLQKAYALQRQRWELWESLNKLIRPQ